MYLIEFKICVIADNGSRVVVTHQIFHLTYVIQMYKSMYSIKNETNSINILFTGSYKFFDTLQCRKGNVLKRILYFSWIKYNEINIRPLFIQNMFPIENGIDKTKSSCTEKCKIFRHITA